MEAGYHGRGGSLRSFSLSLVSRFCVIAERNDPLNCGSRTLARGKFFFFFFFFIFKRIKFHLSKKREKERDRLKIIARHFENSRLFFPIVNWRESGQRRHGDRMKLTHHLLSTAFYPSRFPTRRDTPLSLFFWFELNPSSDQGRRVFFLLLVEGQGWRE